MEELPKKHSVHPRRTRITVVPKRPGKRPDVLTSVKKDPDDLVAAVKKIPVARPSRENPVPALVKKLKNLLKNKRLFRPKAKKYVTFITKQKPRDPTKVPTKITDIVAPIKKITVVPVGRKTVPAKTVPNSIPLEVVPVSVGRVPKVVPKITTSK